MNQLKLYLYKNSSAWIFKQSPSKTHTAYMWYTSVTDPGGIKDRGSTLWHLDQMDWHDQISQISLSLLSYRDGSSGRQCAAGRASGLMEMGR